MSAMSNTGDGAMNGWSEYRRMVVSQLADLQADQRKLQGDVTEIKAQLASLKTEMQLRAGMWGTIAGAVVAGAATLLSTLL